MMTLSSEDKKRLDREIKEDRKRMTPAERREVEELTHIGCPSYPHCDMMPEGCTKVVGDDIDVYDEDDDQGRVCDCGSVKFNLLKSGKTECAKCGKREFQWEEDLLYVPEDSP